MNIQANILHTFSEMLPSRIHFSSELTCRGHWMTLEHTDAKRTWTQIIRISTFADSESDGKENHLLLMNKWGCCWAAAGHWDQLQYEPLALSCAGLKGFAASIGHICMSMGSSRIRPCARNAWESVQDWDLLWESWTTVFPAHTQTACRRSRLHSCHFRPFSHTSHPSFWWRWWKTFSDECFLFWMYHTFWCVWLLYSHSPVSNPSGDDWVKFLHWSRKSNSRKATGSRVACQATVIHISTLTWTKNYPHLDIKSKYFTFF